MKDMKIIVRKINNNTYIILCYEFIVSYNYIFYYDLSKLFFYFLLYIVLFDDLYIFIIFIVYFLFFYKMIIIIKKLGF